MSEAENVEVIQAEWKRDCETCAGEGEYEHPHTPLHHLHSEAPEYAVVKCPDCDGVGWIWTDEMISLSACPVGLFWTRSGSLCLKSEYGNNEGRIDAYIVSSGEFFWGAAPQTIASQRAELVKPIDCDEATVRLSSRPSTQGSELREALEQEWLRGDWYEKWQDATENADTGLMATLEALRGRVEWAILSALAATPSDHPLREALEKVDMCLQNLHGLDPKGKADTFRAVQFEMEQHVAQALSSTNSPVPDGEGWQDIETAPKDGTEIVVHDGTTKTSHVSYWRHGSWHDPDNHYYSETPELVPTHWRPLPAPPAALKDREG